MKATETLVMLLTRPGDVRTLIQYWLWTGDQRDLKDPKEFATTGYDRPSMKRCWELLEMTSRSFTTVIMQLEGDLARVICLFYLVLRGLDTIEDDMTIPDDKKQPLLRSFHKKTVTPGWNFKESGPREADRQLLVEYQFVIEELLSLDQRYRDVIVDICSKMQVGMADYAHKAFVDGEVGVDTFVDLDLYCHFVAGLVGEGLVGLFSASGKESPSVGNQLVLANHMGLFLQKTNVLRDFREDLDSGRLFWPREAYHKHGFKDPKDMYAPGNEDRALWVLSEFTLDALRHATQALDFLAMLRNQSIFNFCAIPQSMAIATLATCYMNPAIFQRSVKIRRAEAASLIMRATNPRDVAYMFRNYSRIIHHKTVPRDPNYLAISLACGKIDQWCEHHYPSFISVTTGVDRKPRQSFDASDARSRIVEKETSRLQVIKDEEKRAIISAGGHVVEDPAVRQNAQAAQDQWDGIIVVAGAIAFFAVVTFGAFFLMLRFWPESW